MEIERLRMFEQYANLLQKSNLDYKTRGRYLDAALFFLNNTDKISKRGFKDFCNKQWETIAVHPHIKEGTLHFLASRGIGWRTFTMKLKKETPIKLSKATERHDDIIKGFIDFCKKEYDYSQSTLNSYMFSAKDFFKYFDEFTNDNVKQYIGHLESCGRSGSTMNLRLSGLTMLAKYLRKPITIKRPKRSKKLNTENVPTKEEYDSICEYLKNKPQWLLSIKIMATTGCRISELLQLTYEQVASGTCVLKGKGGKYRQFFFVDEVQEMARIRVSLGITGVVETVSSRGFSLRLKRIGEEVGIPKEKMHPHAFRHFFAKMYLQKTKDVVGLAELLGHDSVDTTRIYLQKSYDEQKREVNRAVTW